MSLIFCLSTLFKLKAKENQIDDFIGKSGVNCEQIKDSKCFTLLYRVLSYIYDCRTDGIKLNGDIQNIVNRVISKAQSNIANSLKEKDFNNLDDREKLNLVRCMIIYSKYGGNNLKLDDKTIESVKTLIPSRNASVKLLHSLVYLLYYRDKK